MLRISAGLLLCRFLIIRANKIAAHADLVLSVLTSMLLMATFHTYVDHVHYSVLICQYSHHRQVACDKLYNVCLIIPLSSP